MKSKNIKICIHFLKCCQKCCSLIWALKDGQNVSKPVTLFGADQSWEFARNDGKEKEVPENWFD